MIAAQVSTQAVPGLASQPMSAKKKIWHALSKQECQISLVIRTYRSYAHKPFLRTLCVHRYQVPEIGWRFIRGIELVLGCLVSGGEGEGQG